MRHHNNQRHTRSHADRIPNKLMSKEDKVAQKDDCWAQQHLRNKTGGRAGLGRHSFYIDTERDTASS